MFIAVSLALIALGLFGSSLILLVLDHTVLALLAGQVALALAGVAMLIAVSQMSPEQQRKEANRVRTAHSVDTAASRRQGSD